MPDGTIPNRRPVTTTPGDAQPAAEHQASPKNQTDGINAAIDMCRRHGVYNDNTVLIWANPVTGDAAAVSRNPETGACSVERVAHGWYGITSVHESIGAEQDARRAAGEFAECSRCPQDAHAEWCGAGRLQDITRAVRGRGRKRAKA